MRAFASSIDYGESRPLTGTTRGWWRRCVRGGERIGLEGVRLVTVPVVRRIVVGVDGSTASEQALRWACREARLRGAHVHAVRAWEPSGGHVASYAWPGRVPSQTDPSGSDIAAARDDLRRLVESIHERGVVVDAEVVEGLPARVLLDRANGADMLVLGTANHAAMRTAGPVIRACVNRAPCPVVVIGPGQAGPPVPPDAGVAAVSAAGVRVG